MSEENKIEAITATVQNRRAFVKTAAKVAVTAPAAAMLLNASVKSAKAQEVYADAGDPFNTAGHDDAVQTDDGIFGDDGGTPGDFIP